MAGYHARRTPAKAAALTVLLMAAAVLAAVPSASAGRLLRGHSTPRRTLLGGHPSLSPSGASPGVLGSAIGGTSWGGRYAPGGINRPTHWPIIYDEANGWYPELADQPRDYDTTLWGVNGRR